MEFLAGFHTGRALIRPGAFAVVNPHLSDPELRRKGLRLGGDGESSQRLFGMRPGEWSAEPASLLAVISRDNISLLTLLSAYL